MLNKPSASFFIAVFLLFPVSMNLYAAGSVKSKSTIKVCSSNNLVKLEKKLKNYKKIISKYSEKYEVPESLINAVITAESCFNQNAVSPKGAQGLMQLMPGTADRFGVSNSFDADANIRGGTRYLKYLLGYYDEYLIDVIAAYNAGEGAVDKYKGIPPYNETKLYVSKVAALYKLYSQGTKVSSVFKEGKIVSLPKDDQMLISMFKPYPMKQLRFSPYKGRKQNIARGNCANRTSTRLKKSTRLQSGNGVWQRIYTTKRGDTLLRVMQKSGVHKNKIKQMNGLPSRSRLREGQKLLLWECRK